MSRTRPVRTPLQRALVGPAGEHYCLAQLMLRGYLATPAPPGTPEVDILVLSPDGVTVAATVQVKTRTYGHDQGWHFKKKHEQLRYDRMFYALVDFEPTAPAVYIMPSTQIATILAEWFQVWVTTLGARGQQRNPDNPMRRLLPDMGKEVTSGPPGWLDAYRDRYQLLGEPGATPSV
jgi:hypothetical protein